MSVIVVLKESNSIVLGTDSRYVTPDKARAVSDSIEKIQEIAADTFLATSGYSLVCNFQNAKAGELCQSTQDIRTLSRMLAEASKPILEEVAAALAKNVHLHSTIATVIAGTGLLHGAVLAGRSCGELGYVYMESRLVDGRVETQIQECFAAPRNIHITSATDSNSLARLRTNWRFWSDPPVSVVNAIIDAEKAASSMIGGPTQIVKLDSDGSRWIRRLPAATRRATCPVGIGTINAAVTMTSPTLVISGVGGAFTVNIDDTNGVLVSSSGGDKVSLSAGNVQITNSGIGASVAVTSQYINVSTSAGQASLDARHGGSLFLSATALASYSPSNGTLAVSDGTGGYTAGKLYFREGGAWVVVV